MPYIVITTTPEMADTVTPGQPWPRTSTRRAVATLEEARDFAGAAVSDAHEATGQSWNRVWEGWAYEATDLLPESGGMVGPLPDGTVIEVESVTWRDLYTRAGRHPLKALPGYAAIIDAYHARQADAPVPVQIPGTPRHR